MTGELLLYGGIAVMIAAAVIAAAAAVYFWLSGRKLKRCLEQEYGKKRR